MSFYFASDKVRVLKVKQLTGCQRNLGEELEPRKRGDTSKQGEKTGLAHGAIFSFQDSNAAQIM